LDTSKVSEDWNEIAAVQLAGVPVEPAPAAAAKKGAAASPPPPPPPPMTLPPPKAKASAAGITAPLGKAAAAASKAAAGDLMTDLMATVAQGRSALKSVAKPHAAQKVVKKEEGSDTIAAVLLKRFQAMHGTGAYEDLGGHDAWDEKDAAKEAAWADDADEWV